MADQETEELDENGEPIRRWKTIRKLTEFKPQATAFVQYGANHRVFAIVKSDEAGGVTEIPLPTFEAVDESITSLVEISQVLKAPNIDTAARDAVGARLDVVLDRLSPGIQFSAKDFVAKADGVLANFVKACARQDAELGDVAGSLREEILKIAMGSMQPGPALDQPAGLPSPQPVSQAECLLEQQKTDGKEEPLAPQSATTASPPTPGAVDGAALAKTNKQDGDVMQPTTNPTPAVKSEPGTFTPGAGPSAGVGAATELGNLTSKTEPGTFSTGPTEGTNKDKIPGNPTSDAVQAAPTSAATTVTPAMAPPAPGTMTGAASLPQDAGGAGPADDFVHRVQQLLEPAIANFKSEVTTMKTDMKSDMDNFKAQVMKAVEEAVAKAAPPKFEKKPDDGVAKSAPGVPPVIIPASQQLSAPGPVVTGPISSAGVLDMTTHPALSQMDYYGRPLSR